MTGATWIVIQARTSSQRLPGKVLRSLEGRPLLDWLVESMKHADLADGVLVATSLDPRDDALAEHCRQSGLDCFRGSLDNVAQRLLDAALSVGADSLVRISGDSPLLLPLVVDRAIRTCAETTPDLLTNVMPRTFPKGQSVEILATDFLREHIGRFSAPGHFEHVTRFFYDHADEFRIHNMASGREYGQVNLCVDTADDFERISRIIRAMDRPHWRYGCDELVALSHSLGVAS